MQNWSEKHGRKVVAGGMHAGKLFAELSADSLRRAAKRYPADPCLQKFAKAWVALQDMENLGEPEPCALVRVNPERSEPAPTAEQFSCWARHALKGVWMSTKARWLVILVFVCLLAKPALSTFTARAVVQGLRLCVRRTLQLALMLMEGLVDELVYQMEYAMRESLPSGVNFSDFAGAPIQHTSHLLSALIGASMSLLAQTLRAQVQHAA